LGLIKGYDDGSIKPDKEITRGEFVALVNRSFGLQEVSKAVSFSDVPEANWVYGPVSIAVEAGYVSGYSDQTFRPGQPVTREQSALMVSKLLKLGNIASSNKKPFTDILNLSSASQSAIIALYEKGIIKGYSKDTFGPEQLLTRAQAVTMLDSALNQTIVYEKAGVYGPESGVETIYGHVVVASADVTLKNIVISGNLTVAKEVGEGDVHFKGIRVLGETFIQGGGENSVYFEDSVILRISVNKADGSVRVVVAGASSIQYVLVQSPVKLEESFVTDTGFSNVDIGKELPAGSQVELLGQFENVSVLSSNIKVNIPKGSINSLNVQPGANNNKITIDKEASVLKLILDTVTSLLGQGKIEDAIVNKGAQGSNFETEPSKVDGAGAAQPSGTPDPNTGGGIGPVTTPNPSPSPSPSTDPSESPNPSPEPCLSDECKMADLTDITVSDFVIEQLDSYNFTTGETGFNPDIFNYSIINNLTAPTSFEVKIKKPELATAEYYLIIVDQDNRETFKYGTFENDILSLELKPRHDLRLSIAITSGDGKRSKYYNLLIHYPRSIQEAFKLIRREVYYINEEKWVDSYHLTGYVVNGYKLQDSDSITIYRSKEDRTVMGEGYGQLAYLSEELVVSADHKGSFYVEVTREGTVLYEGIYEYDFTPLELIEEDIGIELVPFTKQELIDIVKDDPYLDTPLSGGIHAYFDFDKLTEKLPNARYYLRDGLILDYPRNELPAPYTKELVKMGVVPNGFAGPILSDASVLPDITSGKMQLGDTYFYRHDNDNKVVNDSLQSFIFFDENLNPIGYIIIPVTFDEDHMADGYSSNKTWQPVS